MTSTYLKKQAWNLSQTSFHSPNEIGCEHPHDNVALLPLPLTPRKVEKKWVLLAGMFLFCLHVKDNAIIRQENSEHTWCMSPRSGIEHSFRMCYLNWDNDYLFLPLLEAALFYSENLKTAEDSLESQILTNWPC